MRTRVTAFNKLTLGLAVTVLLHAGVSFQVLAQGSYRSGQHVEPAYEGWRENSDGTYSFIFGYFNENWAAEKP